MATTERIYTIPLRKGVMVAPRTRRAKKAVFVLREYIAKHMKSEDINLSNALNEHIWSQGMRNPIMKVTVSATKDDKNKVFVKLATETLDAKKAAEDKAAKQASDKAEAKAKKADAPAKTESKKDAKSKPAEAAKK